MFASADGANMQKLVTGEQVTAEPTVFASNLLTIVVKPGNPKNVKSLSDLATVSTSCRSVRATVPCGKYANQILTQAGVTIPVDKITRGADVKTTLAAVTTGDADAAIVYVSDAKSAGSSVTDRADPGVAERVRDLSDRADRSVARTRISRTRGSTTRCRPRASGRCRASASCRRRPSE